MKTIDNYLAFVKAVTRDTGLTTLNVDINRVWKTLKSLGKRKQVVLTQRFGLGDEAPKTLGKVARLLQTTRERIWRIEADALRQLRRPCLVRLLTDTTSPLETTEQPFSLEWTKQHKSAKHFAAMSLSFEMEKNGWRFPTAKEVQLAIREGIEGFNRPAFISYYWVEDEGTIHNTIVVKIHGASITPATNKTWANLAFVRTISQSGYIVD